MINFKAILQKFDSDLWGFHVIVPTELAEQFVNNTGRRLVASIGDHRFHCALMPLSGNGWFININKQIRDKTGLRPGDDVSIFIEADTSTYGIPISEELEEVLRQDAEASEIFHALKPGLRRSLIYYADNVKSSNIKVRRALVVLEHLKMNQGKVDFRQLNEAMKAANRANRLT